MVCELIIFQVNEICFLFFYFDVEETLIPLQYAGVQMYVCVPMHHREAASQKEFLLSNCMCCQVFSYKIYLNNVLIHLNESFCSHE